MRDASLRHLDALREQITKLEGEKIALWQKAWAWQLAYRFLEAGAPAAFRVKCFRDNYVEDPTGGR